MARSRSSKGQRDGLTPSLATLLAFPIPIRPWSPPPLINPAQVLHETDRRSRNPFRTETTGDVTYGRLDNPIVPRRKGTLGFNVPDRVGVCVRRNVRREVIFATRKNRAGAGSRRTRNFWSSIKC